MKYKRKKATFGVLAPNIQRGGMAIPLGNNLYWMKGRKHKTGGIDIGKDLEVENNEVMQMLPNETRVFSSVKMLGGNSPAELVASGMDPNMVFNAQEAYKRINRIRDDGSRYKEGGSKYNQWKEEHPTLDTVTDFLPIVSTVKDGIELYNNPSWSNAGWFALDLASDILTAGAGKAVVGAVKGAGKLAKVASKGSKVHKRTRRLINATTSKNVNLGNVIEGGEQVEKIGKKVGLVSGDLWQNYMQNAIQEKEKKSSKKLNEYGGKAKLGKRIKGKANDGSRDIYYDDNKRRWVWGKNQVVLPYGHRVKFSDGYEYQLNSDGTRTRIGKKPNAAEQAITEPMKYTPNNDIPTATLDILTAPLADSDKLYYNGILPLHNPSVYKNAPLYAYRTGDMSYLRNDDTSIYTPTRRARQDLPRKLYEFYNQDTIYMPSSLIENVNRLKQGITINQENVDPSYVYGPNNKIAIDARNHNMQIRDLGNNNYVVDFSDIFDTNNEFFDSKANPMIFSQLGVPIIFTDDESKVNQSFVNEVNKALGKKYGGRKRAKYGYDENGNPIYGLTREYPLPLNTINVIGNLDTLRKAKALFRDDEQRRIMLDQEYDVYRNNVSREFLNYINEFYNNDEFKQSKLDGTLDRNALERLEEGIEIEPTVDQVIDNLYYLRNKTNDVYVTPYNYEIDELPESNEAKRNDEAYRSWYLGNNKNDIDTIFVPRVDNFNNLDIIDNYISEFSHHLQHQPGNEILMGKESDNFYEDEYGNYKPTQEVYDTPGYVEYNAHKIIEPILRSFIYSNYDGDKELRDKAYNAMMNIMKKQANEFKIKKYGGKMNLQNIDNPLARDNKRMISPNKLGTIVRVDGNGRDRLAYIPSTGSSKQDMKCGGRVKALVGTQYTNPLLRYVVDRNGNWGYNGIGYGVPNASHIGMYSDEADQYIPESSKGEIINGDENIAVIPTDDNSTIPILVNTRTHKTNGTNVYSTKRLTPLLPQSSIIPSSIKDLKTMNFNRLTPTNGKGISSYLDIINDITKGESDWQGYAAAGVNALGSVVNSLIMNNAIRKQRPPVRPVPKIPQKFKTKHNIKAELSENREATDQAIKDVVRNTASSQVSRNLVNNLGLQRAIADNKLFAEKENKETELINKDLTNRQTTDHENVDAYNKWLEARNDFYNNRSLLRAQNWATLVNGISSQIGAGLGNIGASRRYRNNVLLAMLPYIKATGNG